MPYMHINPSSSLDRTLIGPQELIFLMISGAFRARPSENPVRAFIHELLLHSARFVDELMVSVLCNYLVFNRIIQIREHDLERLEFLVLSFDLGEELARRGV